MELRSLSASSGAVYELCPARYAAEHERRAPRKTGDAAALGSACHKAMQDFVELGYHEKGLVGGPLSDTIIALFDVAYRHLFSDDRRLLEGRNLCVQWAQRQDWSKKKVLSTEEKREFMIPTKYGDVPFRYIRDRVDQHPNGDIEVVDYKSVVMPVTHEKLRNRLQARCYALSVYLEHPEVNKIWVTFDLLRYEEISVVFSVEECKETLRYLIALAERIIEDQDPQEVLNDECGWCVKKHKCREADLWVTHAGDLLINPEPDKAIEQRYKLGLAQKLLEAKARELDVQIATYMEKSNDTEYHVTTPDYGEVVVTFSSSRRRAVDTKALVNVLTAEQMAQVASIGVTALDELQKSGSLTPSQIKEVREAVSWKHSEPKVGIKKA